MTTTEHIAERQGSLQGVHVLLAEDNPTNQLVAMQMLESLGATVTLAADGAEALGVVQREDFDVLLIDIEMPRVSGLEVIRALRASNGKLADLPLIALTAYVMQEHRVAIDEAGADGIIAKPILSIEQFGEEIRAHMEKRGTKPSAAPLPELMEVAEGDAEIDDSIYEALETAIGSAQMVELLGKVRADISESHTTLQRALPGLSYKGIRSATHVLISVAGAIGARGLQDQAHRLNLAANAMDEASVSTKGPDILSEIQRVLKFVDGRIQG
ncbi:MAG: response regulator [Pseudomonadota bacterium]